MKQCLSVAAGLLAAGLVMAQDIPEPPLPGLLQQLAASHGGVTRLHLLLQVADAYVLKPGEDKRDLDSAFLLIGQVEKGNATIGDSYIHDLGLLIRARAEREAGKTEPGRVDAFTAADAFRQKSDHYPAELAYADYEAAKYLSYTDAREDSQRIALYREAIPLFEKTGRKEMQAETLQIMGDCLSGIAIGVEELPPMLEAMKIYLSIGHTDLRDLYSLIGTVYNHIGDYQKALQYELRALAIEDTMPLSITRYFTANRIGIVYKNFGDYDRAEHYCKIALDVAEHFHDTADITMATINWASARVGQKKYDSALATINQLARRFAFTSNTTRIPLLVGYANLYMSANRVQAAQPVVQQLQVADSSLGPSDSYHVNCELTVIRYFIMTGQFDKARQYSMRYRERMNYLRNSRNLYKAEQFLFQADSAQGRLGDAMAHYQRYIYLRDSVLDSERRMQIAAMQVEYETEKKDRDIVNLTQKQLLSQLELNQAGLTRNFFIVGAILLLVLLVLSANRYRLKQRSNRQLNHLLREKDWLVKEIHHRVKNNLHLISGLLDSQVSFVKTSEAATAIRESQHRVNAMSMVHQKLYQTNDLSMTDMSAYVNEFVAYLGSCFNCGSRIRFDLQVEKVQFGLSQTIPLCLILNEAVTNAIKYAFPGDRKGEITIKLQRQAGNRFLLSVADDGVGIPSDRKNAGSMGMCLMEGLSEDIGGQFSIDGSQGTRIEIVFDREQAA